MHVKLMLVMLLCDLKTGRWRMGRQDRTAVKRRFKRKKGKGKRKRQRNGKGKGRERGKGVKY